MTLSPNTPEGTRHIVETGVGLSHAQLVKYFELVPSMISNNAYEYPAVFVHEVGVARELAVWMTSHDFFLLAGGA